MLLRLTAIWQSIRSSLWAVAAGMVCMAIALAIAAGNVQVGQGDDPVWYLYSGTAENAPQFMSHLVTAMITMATLAISITMVVLTLAAQQLGPRLIHTFMRDWHTQVSLGLFVATVIYLLLVLRSTYGLEDRVPNLAVTIGTALVFVCIVVMLVFVHHLARSIIADNVIQNVGSQLDSEIRRLLPERDDRPEPAPWQSIRNEGAPVHMRSGGYVQALEFDELLRIACAADVLIEFDIRAGNHVVAGSIAGWIRPAAKATDELRHKVASRILIGHERNSVQDLEYSIRHLVEIAVRALSPGVNDPYTAMAVIDRLTISIGRVMTRGRAKDTWEDEQGAVRVKAPVSTFEGITDAAFHQIRQHAGQSPDVLIRLVEKISQLTELADASQGRLLAKHLQLVINAARRGIEEKADLQALEERAAAAMEQHSKRMT
jgi:uncharacterized membrane protein